MSQMLEEHSSTNRHPDSKAVLRRELLAGSFSDGYDSFSLIQSPWHGRTAI